MANTGEWWANQNLNSDLDLVPDLARFDLAKFEVVHLDLKVELDLNSKFCGFTYHWYRVRLTCRRYNTYPVNKKYLYDIQ